MTSISDHHIKDIQAAADTMRKQCEVVVVIGIGGSYLGAKSVIEALSHTFGGLKKKSARPVVVWPGTDELSQFGHPPRLPGPCDRPWQPHQP